MTARDDDRQGFLGRWIKRKAEVRARGETEQAAPPTEEADTSKAPDQDEGKPEEPAFDIASLPSLDDITADTKLADFMRKEVPAALRNAALKRAWALDPAIRDYVNPAREYAYDWNVPGGVPGNGPLEAGFDALKHVAQSLGAPPADHTLDLGDATVEEPQPVKTIGVSEAEPPSPVRISNAKNEPQPSENTSEPPSPADDAAKPAPTRRRHGGAAPV